MRDPSRPIRTAFDRLLTLADSGAHPIQMVDAARRTAAEFREIVADQGGLARLDYLLTVLRMMISAEAGQAERRWDNLSRAGRRDEAEMALRAAEGLARAHEVLATEKVLACGEPTGHIDDDPRTSPETVDGTRSRNLDDRGPRPSLAADRRTAPTARPAGTMDGHGPWQVRRHPSPHPPL